MATIFLSYRRTDSPQACRVYDWLVQRFGGDAVFMDVTAIPVGVSFSDSIREAIANSRILIALIGAHWLDKIDEADDPVRTEIETAIANRIPVLPVLIGGTRMPHPEELPASILAIASQNAATVGVSHDFDTHMQLLLPKIESILGALAIQSVVTSDPEVIYRACQGIVKYLEDKFQEPESSPLSIMSPYRPYWIIGTESAERRQVPFPAVTLSLHRAARLAELLQLHFILSFWADKPESEQIIAGWVMHQLERTPLIPDDYFAPDTIGSECNLKIRPSDEDARQIWKMITDLPLRLSLAYIATVSPKPRN